eukprot:TRINITY_DN13349_c0_g1_i2.p1 TRINITY_DN13349_c0_g1~~TRINITY_DN13349_c0_g1_i2.p1  ORF type:complete len:802 (+),score=131.46 TRINITY_DN13349_c0_g1_i2:56-2407(+)
MSAEDFLARIQVLQQVSKRDRAEISSSLQVELHAVGTDDLCRLLCLSENVLESKVAARTAVKILVRACEGRRDVYLENLLRGGATLPTLLQLAQRVEYADVPVSPSIADEVLAMVMSFTESAATSNGHQVEAGRQHPLVVLLGAVRHFRLDTQMTEAVAESCVAQALLGSNRREDRGRSEEKRPTLSSRQLLETGELMPSWRPFILRTLLGCEFAENDFSATRIAGLKPRDLVRIAQAWGMHENVEVFARLQDLLAAQHKLKSSFPGEAEMPAAAQTARGDCQDAETSCHLLPVLRLADNETIVYVDGSAESDVALRLAADAVSDSRTFVSVGLDAEWEDPRPLSLLQLAVRRRRRQGRNCSGNEECNVAIANKTTQHTDGSHELRRPSEIEIDVTVFVVDMLAPLSVEALDSCRALLRSPNHPAGGNEVLCFGATEDKRRLAVAGVLPELATCFAGSIGFENGGNNCGSGGGSGSSTSALLDCLGWEDLQSRGSWKHLHPGSQPSLQAVVSCQLGAHLDKRFQQSNWDYRPLTREQLEYAALDAAILLRLRDAATASTADGCSSNCRGVGGGCTGDATAADVVSTSLAVVTATGNVDSVTCERGPGSISLQQERERWKEYRQSKNSSRTVGGSAREINSDLRFVVPSSLNKLMRKMRGLGLDTAIILDGPQIKQLSRMAIDEDRIVITQSRKVQLQGAAMNRLYLLRTGNDTDEQLREIIDVFGVDVDVDCLCGRCVQCNTWDWRLTTREEVRGNPQDRRQHNHILFDVSSSCCVSSIKRRA